MFKTIKWRFVAIYFTLVLVALIITGFFIVKRLEITQLKSMEEDMTNTISAMLGSTDQLYRSNMEDRRSQIQNILDEWKVNENYQIYIITNNTEPTILASVNVNSQVVGENALAFKNMEPELIIRSLQGNQDQRILQPVQKTSKEVHLSYPIIESSGEVRGIIYMIGNTYHIKELISDSRSILISALLVSLAVTVVLGHLLARSITQPISQLTQGVIKMQEGDLDQRVEVKSDDEIGILSDMFNGLAMKLQETISEIEIERGKLDTIFEYMQEGVIALDRDNRVIHSNPVASKILDIKKQGEERINLGRLNIFGIDYGDKTTLEGVSFLSLNNRFYNCIYGPFIDEQGQPTGLILVFQDITKEHKLDETRKDFVANVSHELKTPITTIKTYTETIMGQELDSQTRNNFLTVIDQEVDRMTRLVQDLLQLSNIDYHMKKLDLERIRLEDFLDSLLKSLEVLRNQKKLDLKINNRTKDLIINTERDSLEKILRNIIGNAYKYSKDQGLVQLELWEDKEDFFIKVKDQGIGIPYKDQRHIFDRFYRVEKGRSRQAGGTGLGLSISKELIDLMGGEISLKSRPNIGTEVLIRLRKDLGDRDD